MTELWVDASVKMEAGDMVSYNYTPSIAARSAFFYLQGLGHFHCDADYYTQREGYRSYLLIYTVSGKGYAKYRGKSYEIGKGQTLLMDCYEYQEYYTDKKELWEIKWIHFNGSTSGEYFNLIYNKFGPVVNTYESNRILEYIDECARITEANDFQLEARTSRLIVDMLTELLLSETCNNTAFEVKTLNGNVRAAIEYIDKNYDTDISLRDMASAACCSEYHFSRVFKRVTGYSPYEYLTKFRINKAKGLLKSGDMSVEDISMKVGFLSNSNFIRTFKSLEGMTPLKYRKYWVE